MANTVGFYGRVSPLVTPQISRSPFRRKVVPQWHLAQRQVQWPWETSLTYFVQAWQTVLL